MFSFYEFRFSRSIDFSSLFFRSLSLSICSSALISLCYLAHCCLLLFMLYRRCSYSMRFVTVADCLCRVVFVRVFFSHSLCDPIQFGWHFIQSEVACSFEDAALIQLVDVYIDPFFFINIGLKVTFDKVTDQMRLKSIHFSVECYYYGFYMISNRLCNRWDI